MQTTKQVIRKVERLEVEGSLPKLKITTTSGTKVEILPSDYNDRQWSALWEFLSEGDVVKIEHYAGRIQNAYVEIDQQYFWVLETTFEKPGELMLTLENASVNGGRRTAKIRQSDIESRKTFIQNRDGTADDYDHTCIRLEEAIERYEALYFTILGERVAMIETWQ